ncbi:hypothetical protein LJB88_02165 [Erysipelotrichaceae bacterium OttesenSCG-928-M19]|nr:hypothetical protein [Erysipelotrichaceae bacterium OttesenSCG-928-M19]
MGKRSFDEDQHEYLDTTFVKIKDHDKLHDDIDKNVAKITHKVNVIYAILNKIALPLTLTIAGAIISMFFSLLNK